MSKHARLAASQSHRWIACPGSIHMIEQFQDIYPEEDSEYAAEGTFAHELLSEQLEEQYLGGKEARMLQKDQWALEVVHDYVLEQMEFKPSAKIYVDKYVKPYDHRDDMGGTADVIIRSNREVEVIDYKHGRGVYVPVKDNTQLIIYALGVLNKMEDFQGKKFVKQLKRDEYGNCWLEDAYIPDPLQVRITIIQPRHGQAREESPSGNGVMTQVYSMNEMWQWKLDILDHIDRVDDVDKKFERPTYTFDKAYEDGYISPGDPEMRKTGKDPCRFCQLKTICPATLSAAESAKRAMAEFDAFDDAIGADTTLSDDEMQAMIDRLFVLYVDTKKLKTIATATEAMVIRILGNDEYQSMAPEYSLVNKKGNRTWDKEDKVIVARLIKEFGITKMNCYDVKLNSPSKIEENLNASQKRALKDTDLITRPITGKSILYTG